MRLTAFEALFWTYRPGHASSQRFTQQRLAPNSISTPWNNKNQQRTVLKHDSDLVTSLLKYTYTRGSDVYVCSSHFLFLRSHSDTFHSYAFSAVSERTSACT